MAELADAHASKACDRKIIRVRLPSSVQNTAEPMKNVQNTSWTRELAYVVGLLVTDGNLSKDGRHISLRSSDIDLIQTFRKCLSLQTKINTSINNGFEKKPSYLMQFSNAHFYRWLLEIGLFPAKTYTIGEIKVPDQFFRDFLRGHLDGDGTVMMYQDNYGFYKGHQYINQRVYVKFISASKVHIDWLYEKIRKLTLLKGSLAASHPEKPRVPIWTIKFSKIESLKLISWIYYEENLPCLQRKRLLAKQILKTVPNIKRKKYTKIDAC